MGSSRLFHFTPSPPFKDLRKTPTTRSRAPEDILFRAPEFFPWLIHLIHKEFPHTFRLSRLRLFLKTEH
jgi:hypothetical protein